MGSALSFGAAAGLGPLEILGGRGMSAELLQTIAFEGFQFLDGANCMYEDTIGCPTSLTIVK